MSNELDQIVIKNELDQENMDDSIPVLLTEDEIKKEVIEIESISLLTEDEDFNSGFISEPVDIPITVPIPNNLHEFHERCLSEPLSDPKSFECCSSEDMAQRQYLSVPKDFKEDIIPVVSLISESDSDSEPLLEHKQTLKRKRNLIPSYIEVENTRKTLKPGPKSKTRNIVTVHQMITEAKMLRSGVTLDSSDTSDDEMILDAESEDENDSIDDEDDSIDDEDDSIDDEDDSMDDENESNEDKEEEEISEIDPNDDENESDKNEIELSKNDQNHEIISLLSLTDDDTNHLEPEIGELVIGSEASSDDAVEKRALLSPSNNVKINKKLSETLDDKSNEIDEIEGFKNVIDSNKMVNDNKVLENNIIDQNKTEDEDMKNKKIEGEILKNNIVDQNKTEDVNMENKKIEDEILKNNFVDQNKTEDNKMENKTEDVNMENKKIEDEILKNKIVDQNKTEDNKMENKTEDVNITNIKTEDDILLKNNIIDQNKTEDENMKNKNTEDDILLMNNIIDQNKIEDNKNMENKEMIIDSNEILKSGE